MRFKWPSLLKVGAFVAVTGTLVALVGMIFSQVRIEDNVSYQAIFTDASGLATRVDVRASGVTVGAVTSIDLHDDGAVEVTFTVPRTLAMTTVTQARIRYANLTGDRYLELTPGAGSDEAQALEPGATLPVDRTAPALDLDALFAGISPLTQALAPEEINALARNLIGATHGQAPVIDTTIKRLSEFTNGLARYDGLVDKTITNLNTALRNVNKDDAIDRIITLLHDLSLKLDRDKVKVVKGLGDLGVAADDVEKFLRAIRPGFKADIDALGRISRNVNSQQAYLEEILSAYRVNINQLGRLGVNGSFFHFFLCGVRVRVDLPGEADVETPGLLASNPRCNRSPEGN